MTHLTVVNGPQAGTRIELVRGETCTIGSAESCTLRLNQPGIAPVQAEVKALKQEGFGIKKAGGPVAVNGASVDAARLSDGDTIDVGPVQLQFGPPRETTATGAKAGAMLGGFRLFEVLGQGGMGVVHRAEQVSLRRQVALKLLDQELTQNPVFVARFVAEARAAARLHHPNVVQVYDVGNEGSTYFYSMELMTEGSIETKLKAGKMSVDDTLRAVADAARGLAYAESLRIVHRDIKPDNLMLDHHGAVKLVDLGLALTEEDSSGKVVGTPHFMSPEQILRKPLDHRSDLYSLGCTMYRMLAGRNPFTGATVKDILRAQVKDTAEPLHKLDPSIPAEVSAIAAKLMAKEPDERFQSAEELIAGLEEVMRPPARKGLLIAGVVLALAVAGGAIAYAMTRPEGETKIITQQVADPSAAENAKRAREAEAEAAYLRVRTKGLADLAYADALLAMAKEHPETEHARQATAEAAKVRDDYEQRTRAAQARAAQLASEIEALRTRVRDALGKLDFAAAANALQLVEVPEALRGVDAVKEAATALTAELHAAAKGKADGLQGDLEQALRGKDPAAIERAAQSYAAILDGPAAWPSLALTDAASRRGLLTAASEQVRKLREQEAAGQAEAAWTKLTARYSEASGILASVQAWQWQQAKGQANKLAEELQGQASGEQAAALAASLDRAVAHLEKVTQAAQAGGLTLAQGDDGEAHPVASFSGEGDQATFVVKVGPRHQPRTQNVKAKSLEFSALEKVMTLPNGDPAEAANLLGWLQLAMQLEGARSYLLALDPSRDTSGTGDQRYALAGQAPARFAAALGASSEPWAKAMASELQAAAMLADGLQAFSGQRNLAAAEFVERLLREHDRRILVAALR